MSLTTPEMATPPKFEICATLEEMGRKGADLIIEEIRRKPAALLCAASGSSPTLTYQLLAARYRQEPQLFERLRVLKLDEWINLPMSEQGTSESYLRRHLVAPLGIAEERFFSFRSDPEDAPAECKKLRGIVEREGPIDICVLGVGENGHLALNEPAAELTAHAHLAELSESTLRHPMIQHHAASLRHGLTLGVADILRSRKILLLIQGASKRAAAQGLLSGAITTRLPVSLLLLHGDVTYLCRRDVLA